MAPLGRAPAVPIALATTCVLSGDYHDTVWGRPVTSSRELFGQLSLCTQQCGVAWKVVWNKRQHYSNAFHGWDMHRVAKMTPSEIDVLCAKDGPWAGKLMQNRNKLGAIVHNAKLCCKIEASHADGLSGFLWGFVEGRDGVVNQGERCAGEAYERMFGATGVISDEMATAMVKCKGSKKGSAVVDGAPLDFKYLGSVTLQAFLLQNGLLDGHSATCPAAQRNRQARPCAGAGGVVRDVKPGKRRRSVRV